MANTLYGKFKEAALSHTPSIDFDADTIMVILAGQSAAYTPNASTDDFFNDIVGPYGNSGGTAFNSGATLGTKTVTLGVFDSADPTLTTVTAGNACEQIVLYKSITDGPSSPLIAWMDTATAGLPVTPNGGDILITWNASGIFGL